MSYDPEDDETTLYIAYVDDEKYGLKGWTQNKQLMKYFLEFHNCDKIKHKKYTDTNKNIIEFANNNMAYEIEIHRIKSQDNDGKPIDLYVPMTSSEMSDIVDSCTYFNAHNINYNSIISAYKVLKRKYQEALNILLFMDVAKHVMDYRVFQNDHNSQNKVYMIERDMLITLYRLEPELF